MDKPPIIQLGIVSKKVIRGPKKEITMPKHDVTTIVIMEAFLENATHDMDSPYVVFGHPPKRAPTIEPTPSPIKVRSSPGSFNKSCPMIKDKFLWSAICSAKTANAKGI